MSHDTEHQRMSPELRYQRDMYFRVLVDNLYHFVARCEFTPTELREAVVLACIKHETTRVRPSFLVRRDDLVGGARVEMLYDELRSQRKEDDR